MNILQLIASNSFISTNKLLIKRFGLIEANIVGLFAGMSDYNKDNDDGWFYVTYERIEDELNISKHISSKAIESLMKANILMDKKKGVPCRRFFKFNNDKLLQCFGVMAIKPEESDAPPEVKNFNSLELNNSTTSNKKNKLQADKNFNDYNSNIIINNNNKNNNTSFSAEAKKEEKKEDLNKENEIKEIEKSCTSSKSISEKDKIQLIISYFDLKGYKSCVQTFLLYHKLNIHDTFKKLPYFADKWEHKFEDLTKLSQNNTKEISLSKEEERAWKFTEAKFEYAKKHFKNPDSLTKEELDNIKQALENEEGNS